MVVVTAVGGAGKPAIFKVEVGTINIIPGLGGINDRLPLPGSISRIWIYLELLPHRVTPEPFQPGIGKGYGEGEVVARPGGGSNPDPVAGSATAGSSWHFTHYLGIAPGDDGCLHVCSAFPPELYLACALSSAKVGAGNSDRALCPG